MTECVAGRATKKEMGHLVFFPAVCSAVKERDKPCMALAGPCRKGDLAGSPLPQQGVNNGFYISGPQSANVALCEGQLQPGFVPEGLGAETAIAGDSWRLKGGNPPPPCSLASGPEACSSPGKSETENKGTKYFPFKLKLRESRVRTTRFGKYGKICLLPAPTLPEALEVERRI